MKKVLLLVMIFATTAVVNKVAAQSDWRMGFSAIPGVASNGGYGFVFGADARIQKEIKPTTHFILTTGFTQFFRKNNTAAMGYIPLKAGLKYFLEKNLYTAGEVGIGFGAVKNTGRSFIWSPSIGLSLKKVDISIKYEDATNFTFNDGKTTNRFVKHFGLRIAYGFALD